MNLFSRLASPRPLNQLITGLGAYYTFQNVASLVDSSGNGHTLTTSGSPTNDTGIIGNGMKCVAGSSQYAGAAINPGAQTKVSLSCWINRSSTASFASIGWLDTNFRAWGINLFNDGNIYLGCGDGAHNNFGSIAGSQTGWHHFVFVFDGTLADTSKRCALYIDGELFYVVVSPAAPSTYTPSGSFRVGYDQLNSHFSSATFDEVAIYFGVALTQTKVQGLFGAGSPPGNPPAYPFTSAVDFTNIAVPSGGLPKAAWAASNIVNSGATFLLPTAVNRIRQTGVVGGARILLVGADATATAIKFKVFRYNGSTYDYISGTDWLGPLVDGRNVFTFPTPIACQAGDYLGVALNTGITSQISVAGSGALLFALGDISSTNAFAGSAAFTLNCEALTRPPRICICGDSIPSGFNGANKWKTFADGDGPSGTITSEPFYNLNLLLTRPVEYQNFAKAGSTYADASLTWVPAAVACRPTAILVEAGANDVATGRTWSDVVIDLDRIKTLLVNGEQLFIAEILPWTAGNDSQAAVLRDINAHLGPWCTANGAIFLAIHDPMAQLRVSTGFLDDMKTAYNYSDNTHLTTPAGVQALAALWQSYMILD